MNEKLMRIFPAGSLWPLGVDVKQELFSSQAKDENGNIFKRNDIGMWYQVFNPEPLEGG